MDIQTVAHRGLRLYIERGDRSGLAPATIQKISVIVSYLQVTKHFDVLVKEKRWGLHPLKGDRKGTWSLSVTGNWRMTFRVNSATNEIFDLNLEDYHQG